MSISNLLQPNPMVTVMHWLPSERGWIKLNTNGVTSSNSSNTSIGGVFRDSECGYWMMIGKDTIFRIEARSVLEGLRVAWEKGFRQLDLECDNALMVESFLAGGVANSRMMELCLIHQLLCRNWKVQVRHISSSHCEVIDHMAKTATVGFTSSQLFDKPPILV